MILTKDKPYHWQCGPWKKTWKDLIVSNELSRFVHGGWECYRIHCVISHLFLLLDILSMVVCKEEVSPEPEGRSSLLQEEPEPPHIKEEQEEILQRPEEPEGSTWTSAAVKSEEDDEDISSHRSEVEVKLESDSEVTEDSDDWEETNGGQ